MSEHVRVVTDRPGVLRYLHRGEAEAGENLVLGHLEVPALWERQGLGGFDARAVHVFSNGFQSWSPGWELAPGERLPRVRLLRRLETYIERPELRRGLQGARLGRRGTVVSHHLIYFRCGDRYLALVSCADAGAPLSFYYRRRSGELTIEAYCRGQSFTDRETVAEVAVLAAQGYFRLKDALRREFPERLKRLARPPGSPGLAGWESWYNHYHDIDEQLVLDNLEGLTRSGNFVRRWCRDRGEQGLFQIDDGWEQSIGDWEADERRFPGGMAALAERIRAAGCTPGLWLAPFLVVRRSRLFREHPEWLLRDSRGRPVAAGFQPRWGGNFYTLDLSCPEVQDFLRETAERVVSRWGFTFLKLDFLYAGMLPGSRRSGGSAHHWYREAVRILTTAGRAPAGEPVRCLGCGAPLLGAGDPFTLMRIGADTLERWDDPGLRLLGYAGRPSARINLRDSLGRAFLNGTLYRNDPDVLFFRRRNIRLGRLEKELVAVVGFLFGSLLMSSDDLHLLDPEEERFTEHCLELFAALGSGEYGVQRLERDVYRLFERAGKIAGIVNLRDRPFAAEPGPLGLDPAAGEALLANWSRRGRAWEFLPRSVSLVRRTPGLPIPRAPSRPGVPCRASGARGGPPRSRTGSGPRTGP